MPHRIQHQMGKPLLGTDVGHFFASTIHLSYHTDYVVARAVLARIALERWDTQPNCKRSPLDGTCVPERNVLVLNRRKFGNFMHRTVRVIGAQGAETFWNQSNVLIGRRNGANRHLFRPYFPQLRRSFRERDIQTQWAQSGSEREPRQIDGTYLRQKDGPIVDIIFRRQREMKIRWSNENNGQPLT